MLLWTALAAAVGGGGYYFFRSGDDSLADIKAKVDDEKIKAHAKQTAGAVKDRAEDAIDQGRVRLDRAAFKTEKEYEAAKAKAQELYDSAKDRTKSAFDSMKHIPDDTKHQAHEAQRALEETNRKGLFDRAEQSVDAAKRSTQETYRDVRDNAERKAAELKHDAEKTGEQVKQGWFSWLGWGKSKASEAEAAVKEREAQAARDLENLKKSGAQKVANAAEDVRNRAEKHT